MNCAGCGRPLEINSEAFEGCIVYCNDCPFPEDPCETCGSETCDGSCCDCETCVARRQAIENRK